MMYNCQSLARQTIAARPRLVPCKLGADIAHYIQQEVVIEGKLSDSKTQVQYVSGCHPCWAKLLLNSCSTRSTCMKSDTGRWLPPVIGDVSERLAGLLTEVRVLAHTFAVALHSFVLVQLEYVIIGNMRYHGEHALSWGTCVIMENMRKIGIAGASA
jgi:hypothetical protein